MKKKDEARRLDLAKRKRMEASGWRVGSVRELLKLSTQEAAMIQIKLALAHSLQNRRMRSRLTQAQLARRIHSSQPRVAKMETGDASVSLDLLVRTLLALGASPRDVAKAIGTRPA